MRRGLARTTAVALALTAVLTTGVEADGHLEVVASFDPAQLELPEGVAFDRRGNAYVSLGPPFFVGGGYGAIERIAPDGTRTTMIEFPDGPAVAGLAVDRHNTVYFALPNPGQPDAGVYRLTDDGAERLPGTEQMVVPNGLAINRRGDVFATDSIRGEVWRIPRDGSDAAPWLAHELLAGCDGDVGANGIAFWRRDMLVANTTRGLLVRIPVERNGSPGAPEIVAGDVDCDPTDELFSIDGIALDVLGRVYAPLVLVNELVRINPRRGTVTTLLDEDDGLWNPASLAFGTTWGDRRSLYVTNYAVLPPAPTANVGPALVRIDVRVPGARVPSRPCLWCSWWR